MRAIAIVVYAFTYLWPLPCTLLGLSIGLFPFLGKRSIAIRRGTICIHGKGMERLLKRIPIEGGAAAITFGHTILATNLQSLDNCFEHEWIHVRQYLWWGPVFLPAYILNSFWHWSIGDDRYLDNAFERQARKYSDELILHGGHDESGSL
ncbi:MAG: hypothetical protein ABL921_25110 [Pirellula sp.]